MCNVDSNGRCGHVRSTSSSPPTAPTSPSAPSSRAWRSPRRSVAKVTAVTVTEPWTAAVSGEWAVAFPVEEYEKAAAANAEKVLDAGAARPRRASASPATPCTCKDQYRGRRHRRGGEGARLRSHRDGLARAARHRQVRARQPGDARARAQHGAAAHLPVDCVLGVPPSSRQRRAISDRHPRHSSCRGSASFALFGTPRW